MKLTLIGMNNFLDDHLFDNMQLPSGIDAEVVKNNILMRGGEFEVIYAEPYFNQSLIGNWSKKWFRTFEKWVKAQNIDYNPLENYDRIEDSTDTGSVSAQDHSTATGSGSSEDKVSAYDSDTYQPSAQASSTSGSSSDSNSSSNSANTHHARLHGNIGVTTSQQMLQSEYDIASWNIIEHITDMFLAEFVIPIYD